MTTSSQINKILQSNDQFLGCYSPTQLPKILPSPRKYLIINTISSKIKLGHWTVIYFKSKTQVFYFNSFGGKLMNENIKKFLASRYKFVYYNQSQIQSFKSTNCAFFCIYFIQTVKCKHDYARFLKLFNTRNFKENDNILYKLMYNTRKRKRE